MRYSGPAALACLLVALPHLARSAENEASPWNLSSLSRAPLVYKAPQQQPTNGIKAIFYKGLPWKGKPTRIFAY